MCNTAFAQMLTLIPNPNDNENLASNDNKAGYYRLGFCANTFDTSAGIGFGSTATAVIAMAKISADFITPYMGAELVGINVGLCETVNNISVFVRETPTGANIAYKTLSSLSSGWNEVVFETPLVLEKKEYYFGYKIPVLPCGTYPFGFTSYCATTEGAFLLSIDNTGFADYTKDFGALTVQMLLSGSDEMFANIVDIAYVNMPKNIEVNTAINIPIKIRNSGTNDINNIEITYSLGTN